MGFSSVDLSYIDISSVNEWQGGRYVKETGVYTSESVTMCLKNCYSVAKDFIYEFTVSDSSVSFSVVEYGADMKFLQTLDVQNGGKYVAGSDVLFVGVNIEFPRGHVANAKELFDNGVVFGLNVIQTEIPNDTDYTEILTEIRQECENISSGVQKIGGDVKVILVFVVIAFCWSCMRQWRKNILKMGE